MISKCSYPCNDINRDFIYPDFTGNDESISIVMISEAPPIEHSEYYYQSKDGAFFQTTQIAFNDAGYRIESYDELTNLGVYLTTAIKCSKCDYLVSSKTIKECAFRYLESELQRFINIKVIMCMGDFAIKAVNYIYRNNYGITPIKRGSTYKIRKEKFIFNGIRFIPSYTQTGGSFNIETSKRIMIAEDIKLALSIVNN